MSEREYDDDHNGHATKDKTRDLEAASSQGVVTHLDLWWCFLIMFLVQLGCAVLGAPSPRLLDMIVCREYLERNDPGSIPQYGDVPEVICKAISGRANLIGPVIGSVATQHHAWIPFAIATASFSLLLVPALLYTEEIDRQSLKTTSRSTEEAVVEAEPLLRESADRVDKPVRQQHNECFPRAMSVVMPVCYSSFFFMAAARNFANFILSWVSQRFEQTMAKVRPTFPSQQAVLLLIQVTNSTNS